MPRAALTLLVGLGVVVSATTQADLLDDAPTRADNAVVAAVLKDLLAYSGKDSPLPGFGPEKPIPVNRIPSASSSVDVGRFPDGLDSRGWGRVKATHAQALSQAIKDLARRAPQAEGQFDVAVADVAWRVGRPRPSAVSIFYRSIEFMLPGYSVDRALAVVSFSVPWSIHSVGATYALVADGGKWRVVARQFDYYL